MILKYTQYLHYDNDDSSEMEDAIEEMVEDGADETTARAFVESNPFYEIEVECSLDTLTGARTYQVL